MSDLKLRVIGGCPRGEASSPYARSYLERVAEVSRWADDAGWEAILVYTDNLLVDPWIVSQAIIQNTKRLRPLVAVQPVYMHPYAVAKMVTSFAMLYGRPVYLNFVAGGFKRDLDALNDVTPHDLRYRRIIEYASIIRTLLDNRIATFDGAFYKTRGLSLTPQCPPDMKSFFTLSGSSAAGLAAARELGAIAVHYLRPSGDYVDVQFDPAVEYGTRLGVLARPKSGDAWDIARRRFPETPNGQLIHKVAAGLSDSVWVKELEREIVVPEGHPYWLGPYKNYQLFCPLLVGSWEDVAQELANYIHLGFKTLLLEAPMDADDSRQINHVLELAHDLVRKRMNG
jgi:alkanesulfonate monooxygenase